MNEHSLEVANLTKRFGPVVAVDGVTFDLGTHELLALVGPSGCGKSTLLRLIGGLHAADSGTIRLAGDTIDDGRRSVPPEQRRIGLVFQDHALFPHLDVADNIGFGVRDRSDRGRRVTEMLELVGLDGYGQRFPHELSGGERQRIALARALAQRPVLLLLDEPFASLDPNLRSRIRDDVVAILRSTQTPAVFVTHDQRDALAVGDRIAVMNAGRINQVDTPYGIYHQPRDRFTATFMGDADFLRPSDIHLLGPHVDTNGADMYMVRPDDIDLDGAATTTGADRSATITGAEFRGSTWCYTLTLNSGAVVRTTQPHHVTIPLGSSVQPILKTDHQPVPIAELPAGPA